MLFLRNEVALRWMYNMGNADLGTLCFTRKHTLSVSTYQAILLMLFNQNPKSTFLELQRATGIPEAECKRQLLSLTVSRNKATAWVAIVWDLNRLQ